MNYEKYSYGAYNLHIINTNKFKTIKVTVNFRTKSLENEITIRNILKINLIPDYILYPNYFKNNNNSYKNFKFISLNMRK